MTSESANVAIAMSGGVDSSVAASILSRAGHDVTGMTMRIFPECDAPKASSSIEEARHIAALLGIPHHVAELTEPFRREVVDYFFAEYRRGRTPNPCVRCNQRIKFAALYEQARDLGAEYLATGHYVRVVPREGRLAICRAEYREKDQSYVLAGLTQEQLRHVLFPLGTQDKQQTRAMAKALGLGIAEIPESQDICFLEGGNYRRFLQEHGQCGTPGPILSTTGKVLGMHTGLTDYTIGQRRGLGISAPEPYYVLRLDPERNAVIVGHHRETFANRLVARDVVWGGLPPQSEPFPCDIQIRYRHDPAPCTIEPGPDSFTAMFDSPQRAVTPGQWAVLYRNDMVLAAGTIDTFA